MFKKEIYQDRRNRLKKLVSDGIILLPGNSESPINGPDNFFPFRQDSCFLYYTGLDVPDLVLVIDTESGNDLLFGENPAADSFFWSGQQPTLEDNANKSGIERHASIHQLESVLQKARSQNRPLHILPPYQSDVILRLSQLLESSPADLPNKVSDRLIKAVIEMRSIKDDLEIKEIEAAVDIAGSMHSTARIMAMPGAYEQDIKGVIEGIASSRGAYTAFKPIVTIRGDILHNPRYSNTLESGRLLVVDAGAEANSHYSSDITRTIPVGGTFTRMQRNIYEIVLKANLTALEFIKPGVPYRDVHLKVALEITNGLKDLGIMKGDPEAAVSKGAHALFYPHGLGHMLGLDVHDMESLGEDAVGYDDTYSRSDQFGLNHLRLAKPLSEGNVITVEPGIYFIQSLIDNWKNDKKHLEFINYNQVDLYLGIGGVRIEDDVLVNESGCRVLGKPIPKTVKEVELF